MNGASKNGRLIRFSNFELDRDSGELFKQGRKIKLQGQPFELLIALLERPGEVVTREELRQRVWPSDTAGDFDHGLNRAINRIREALGDSAETPRLIETLPRRGYRFIGSIQEQRAEAPPPELVAAVSAAQAAVARVEETKPKPRKNVWMPAALAATFLAAGLASWMALHRPSSSGQIQIQQLTTNSAENPVWHAVISPDGKYMAYGDLAGIQVRLIATGESHLLPRPQSLKAGDAWFPAAWLPDGTRILATSMTSRAITAWSVSLIGGAAAVLRENALVESVSPDGSLVAFLTSSHMDHAENAINRRLLWNSEIWTMDRDGENARRVVTGDNLTYFGSVRWSPDGKRIAYQKFRFANGVLVDYTIKSCDLNGATPSLVLAKRNRFGTSMEQNFPEDFCWLADGRLIYAIGEPAPNSRDSNLWAVAVEIKSGKALSQPRKITNVAGFHMEALSVTPNGSKLLFESSSDQSYVYVGRLGADGKLQRPRRLTPDQRYNNPFGWTSDSKAVIFLSDRTGTFALYKQALDQEVPELIPTTPGIQFAARLSPGGAWVIYPALSNKDSHGEYRLMRMPLAGGRPQVIFERTSFTDFNCPNRSGSQCVICESAPDGNQNVFSGFDPMSNTRRELFRMTRKPVNWSLSPDGARIAMIGDDPGHIEMRSLTGQIDTRIELKGWPNPLTMDWAADSKAVFISHAGLIESPSGRIGTTLLRVDLQGHVLPLWETRGARFTWCIPSPDGKYLAIRGATTERNAWMMENF